MGYQESYMRMKDSKDFNKLIDTIRKYGMEKFKLSTPVEIITLSKPIDVNLTYLPEAEANIKFDKGEKFIYVVGRRFMQASARDFFQECSNVDEYILNNLEIYFTEYFPSYEIFANNSDLAIHEDFQWIQE